MPFVDIRFWFVFPFRLWAEVQGDEAKAGHPGPEETLGVSDIHVILLSSMESKALRLMSHIGFPTSWDFPN